MADDNTLRPIENMREKHRGGPLESLRSPLKVTTRLLSDERYNTRHELTTTGQILQFL